MATNEIARYFEELTIILTRNKQIFTLDLLMIQFLWRKIPDNFIKQ